MFYVFLNEVGEKRADYDRQIHNYLEKFESFNFSPDDPKGREILNGFVKMLKAMQRDSGGKLDKNEQFKRILKNIEDLLEIYGGKAS